MYSFAGVKIYNVYRQVSPRQVGDEWEAIIALIGTVRAKDSAEAFREASKICKHPIISPARH